MNPCNISKKTRAPRRASVIFATVETGTDFWLPGRKQSFLKVGVIRADCHGERFFVNPFRSVFVTAPKKAEPESELARMFREDSQRMQGEVAEVCAQTSPFVNLLSQQKFPAVAVEDLPQRTHFVGDDCKGGHCCPEGPKGPEGDPGHWERSGGVTQEQNEARFPQSQNITGPTS